jgi:hypothetical protein
MLTNDPSYWNGSTRKNTCCAAFDIGDNKEIEGSMKWAEHTSVGTMKNREQPLVILGQYKMKWNDYSCFDEKRNGTFRYVSVKVAK